MKLQGDPIPRKDWDGKVTFRRLPDAVAFDHRLNASAVRVAATMDYLTGGGPVLFVSNKHLARTAMLGIGTVKASLTKLHNAGHIVRPVGVANDRDREIILNWSSRGRRWGYLASIQLPPKKSKSKGPGRPKGRNGGSKNDHHFDEPISENGGQKTTQGWSKNDPPVGQKMTTENYVVVDNNEQENERGRFSAQGQRQRSGADPFQEPEASGAPGPQPPKALAAPRHEATARPGPGETLADPARGGRDVVPVPALSRAQGADVPALLDAPEAEPGGAPGEEPQASEERGDPNPLAPTFSGRPRGARPAAAPGRRRAQVSEADKAGMRAATLMLLPREIQARYLETEGESREWLDGQLEKGNTSPVIRALTEPDGPEDDHGDPTDDPDSDAPDHGHLGDPEDPIPRPPAMAPVVTVPTGPVDRPEAMALGTRPEGSRPNGPGPAMVETPLANTLDALAAHLESKGPDGAVIVRRATQRNQAEESARAKAVTEIDKSQEAVAAALRGEARLTKVQDDSLAILAGIGPGSPKAELERARNILARDLKDPHSSGGFYRVAQAVAEGQLAPVVLAGAYLHGLKAPPGQEGKWFMGQARRMGYQPSPKSANRAR